MILDEKTIRKYKRIRFWCKLRVIFDFTLWFRNSNRNTTERMEFLIMYFMDLVQREQDPTSVVTSSSEMSITIGELFVWNSNAPYADMEFGFSKWAILSSSVKTVEDGKSFDRRPYHPPRWLALYMRKHVIQIVKNRIFTNPSFTPIIRVI